MATNSTLTVSELDFDKIKSSLQTYLQGSLSAGRVQSITVMIIVNKENVHKKLLSGYGSFGCSYYIFYTQSIFL